MLELEKEVLRLKGEKASLLGKAAVRILPKEVYELEEKEVNEGDEKKGGKGWFMGRGGAKETRQSETLPEPP